MLAGQDSMEEVVKEVPEEEEEAVEEEAVEDDEEAEKDEEEKKNEWPVEPIMGAINITNFICLESVCYSIPTFYKIQQRLSNRKFQYPLF